MFKSMLHQIRIAFILFMLLTILTGLIYPVIITGLAQWLFPWQANGSIIENDHKKIGSLFIGQSFTNPRYFWGRPSATTPFAYNAERSTGSNMGPSNPDFLHAVHARILYLRQHDPDNQPLIPVDLVTASGSGLDPEISPLAAFYQIPRIAALRNIRERDLEALVRNLIKSRTFSILGEPRVNVLQLNLLLDRKENDGAYPTKP